MFQNRQVTQPFRPTTTPQNTQSPCRSPTKAAMTLTFLRGMQALTLPAAEATSPTPKPLESTPRLTTLSPSCATISTRVSAPKRLEAGRAVSDRVWMRTTVNERGENLNSLQDKTGKLIAQDRIALTCVSLTWLAFSLIDNLAVSAQGFRRGANRVRKQMWWKDMKMRSKLTRSLSLPLLAYD